MRKELAGTWGAGVQEKEEEEARHSQTLEQSKLG